MICSLGATKEDLCVEAVVAADVTVAEAAADAATTAAIEPDAGFPSILAVEEGCRCFSSLSNSATRVTRPCTTSRNCLTSSADAGAWALACARPSGHHASSARHIPIV